MFAVGQRWISESENELGLGIINEINHRTLSVFFPASDQQRVYAIAEAPLVRVLFQQGDQISHQQGWKADVLAVHLQNNIAVYLVKNLQNNQEIILHEKDLSHQITFSKPQQRLFSAQIDRNDRFELRYQALQNQQSQFQSPLRGLQGIRAGLIPHQLHIAKEVGQRIAPRVLLADEVGLGKTIEAGMILQQQIFAERAERTLILVPENLQHQWLVEMLRRFNLHFTLFDEERAADFNATDNQVEINPFDTENYIICSLDWIVSSPKRMQQLISSQFDMLMVDEAHHLKWSENQPSIEYQLVERLSAQIPSVLLLTATPEQLGQASHFARLKLLDADRFYDYHQFLQEQQQYQNVADAIQNLCEFRSLSSQQKSMIAELLQEKDKGFIDSLELQTENDSARQQLINCLIDRHGTSRLLFRNTRQGVKGFPKRIYHPVVFQQEQQNLSSTVEPRIDWLANFLCSNRKQKVFVICQQTETVLQLEQILREKYGIHSAVFHEKLSIIERDRAAAYFSDMQYGAQVLLSSNIGVEGRNFQFAQHLVLFDLPAHPDLLEQSIGRLDRIGQQQDIQIYTLYFNQSSEQRLADWYHYGLNAFEQTCPMGSALFEKCGEKLQYFLQNPTQATEFEQFLQQTAQQCQQLKLELENGRDRLLELNSQGGEAAKQLADAIQQQDNSPSLVNFSLNLFDIIGVEQEDIDEQSIVLFPTGTMLIPDFPGLKADGVTVTFNRQLALAREDVEFLTWDHPMIRNGIDLILSSHIGKTAASLLINKKLPAGTLLLECIYIVETQSPKGLQLNRFLPPTPVRLLLDHQGNNLATQVSFSTLSKQLKPLNHSIASKMVKAARPHIEKILAKGEQLIAQQAESIISQAKLQAQQQIGYELQRLMQLQKVNKSIRSAEIEALHQQLQQSEYYLNQANWRLDSLRMIISNQQ